MSITDELRKYISGPARCGISHICEKNIAAIADRIDAEHDKAIRELNNLADAIGDACVFLPKDADGAPIRIGDELDGYGCPNGGAYCKAIVNETMILAGTKDSSYTTWLMWDARSVRHHELTVEDVLLEFAGTLASAENNWGSDVNDAIAEYAAKLQLRGDVE